MKNLSAMIFLGFFFLGACTTKNHKEDNLSSRKPSSSRNHSEKADCSIFPKVRGKYTQKGCLLKRNSDTVIIFFRGLYEDKFVVSKSKKEKAVIDVLFKGDVRLSKYGLKSSIFASTQSKVYLSQRDIDTILEASGAKKIILAAHSGGHHGLRHVLKIKNLNNKYNIRGIWLLDCFYNDQGVLELLQKAFTKDKLAKDCFGYSTPGSTGNRFKKYKKLGICHRYSPKTRVSHVGGVKACVDDFERDRVCNPKN